MLNTEILSLVSNSLNKDQNISLDSFKNVFNGLVENKDKFKNSYLNLYIYEKFCKTKDIQSRKTSARDFEDFLAAVFGGEVTDSTIRHNKNEDNIFVENNFITEWVVNNRREKADILYKNGFKLTVKTLVESNKEINMGAFEKKALFSEFDIVQFLEERVSTNKGIGLGSKPQILNLLNNIAKNGFWKKFAKRFIEMSKSIYSEDIIIFIKSHDTPRIYLVSSEKFINKIYECSESPESFIKLVNRWEGNNIRMDRNTILSDIEPIRLNFEYLNKHIITKVNSNISALIKNFILYTEDHSNKDNHREKIYSICEETLKDIDNNINHLI